MRFIALFSALFALFSTLVVAAPVVPEGEISKRCLGSGCRYSTTSSTPSNQDNAGAMITAIQVLLNSLQDIVQNNSPSADAPPASTTTASSSTASPAPTGA